jgi:hypothetical protein
MVQIPHHNLVGGVVTQHAKIVERNIDEVARNVEQIAHEDDDSEQEEQEEPVASEMTAWVVTTAPGEQK